MYQVIPERTIKDCAAELQDDEPENSFALLLKEGKKFKEALLTPIYIFDTNTKEVIVTSREKMNMKYN